MSLNLPTNGGMTHPSPKLGLHCFTFSVGVKVTLASRTVCCLKAKECVFLTQLCLFEKLTAALV